SLKVISTSPGHKSLTCRHCSLPGSSCPPTKSSLASLLSQTTCKRHWLRKIMEPGLPQEIFRSL
ncbi:hypothetical protein BGZ81_004314, partial [Podila clonocystis]